MALNNGFEAYEIHFKPTFIFYTTPLSFCLMLLSSITDVPTHPSDTCAVADSIFSSAEVHIGALS